MLLTMNSFSRFSAPRSDDARGIERSNSVRTGLGTAWKINKTILGSNNNWQEDSKIHVEM